MAELKQTGPERFLRMARDRGIDRVVVNKLVPFARTPSDHSRSFIWQPFGWIAKWLMPPRQTWRLAYRPGRYASTPLRVAAAEPIYEDDLIVVYRLP